MAAQKTQKDQNHFVTITLNDVLPDTLEGVEARLVTVAEEFTTYESQLNDWNQRMVSGLLRQKDVLRLREKPEEVLSEKDALIKQLQEQLAAAQASAGKKTGADSIGPATDADQEKFYEAARKLGAGFHAQADIYKKLEWHYAHAAVVVNRLIARGFLELQAGKGRGKPVKVIDKNRAYETEPQTTLA